MYRSGTAISVREDETWTDTGCIIIRNFWKIFLTQKMFFGPGKTNAGTTDGMIGFERYEGLKRKG